MKLIMLFTTKYKNKFEAEFEEYGKFLEQIPSSIFKKLKEKNILHDPKKIQAYLMSEKFDIAEE